MILLCAGAMIACGPEEPKTVREQIEDCFNPWDGNLDALEDLVRPLLVDEGSMKTLRTRFGTRPDASGNVGVTMEFEARTAYGVLVKMVANGELHYETCGVTLLEVYEQ